MLFKVISVRFIFDGVLHIYHQGKFVFFVSFCELHFSLALNDVY